MKTKEEVLDIMQSVSMCGCQTAMFTCGNNGNSAYTSANVDDFFNSYYESQYLVTEDWLLTDVRKAEKEDVDIEIWAQEFSENCKNDLMNTMEDGNLYIATFINELYGEISIMIWE